MRLFFSVHKEKYEKQTANSVKMLMNWMSQTWRVGSICCVFTGAEVSIPGRKSPTLEVVLLPCYQNLSVVLNLNH